MKTLILVTLFLVSVSFHAEASDVDKGIAALENNVSASEHNLEQYQRNLEIVQKNGQEMQRSLNELESYKKTLEKSGKNITGNTDSLEEAKKRILTLMNQEKSLLKEDELRIVEIRKLLEMAERTAKERQVVVKVYQAKLIEVDAEKQAWLQQNSNMGDLLKDVEKRRKQTMAEKAKWDQKEKDYKKEISRWDSESRKSKTLLTRYQRLQK
jgi:chromosome segregation ATPase